MFDSNFLTWQKPALTGAALAAFNILYLMVVFLDVCMTPFFCKIAMLCIFVGLAAKLAMPNALAGMEDVQPLSQEAVKTTASLVTDALNRSTARAVDTVMWRSTSRTVKALVGLEVVRRLAPWMSLTVMIFWGGNSVFVVPYVVEKKWDVIEQKIQPQVKQLLALKDQLHSKIPKYTDLDEKWD
mmetsp:Transcript_52146/g.158433  ORF Transcript_52146/g.158433 Transcript_52146/m.158433 type:complete len:184 (-) Transcript_52146:89-640(-)|eukprot:CAMPEP_0198538800 /NCGR_PEP_ID=MMETSP1462-20131121/48067_1 /TAXON_ID=1333877 /ORGANISM="Brandtodinium nutriculum, Strain RCC3387" /LENGTH=183 /DNA_ID=CAMNT_0044268835 /DNA_START=111 /DNA_END=662 /DNA_ORIENTATION=+